ncbi:MULTISPECIES: hypothetical protein [Rhodococcus]|uniref:Uncharacterized protein n=1 Tax=Rhodococcus opacus TaxID=37919 RepID=A0A076F0B7_RHOOP|nr:MULTISPECIES: hypothetical protein [Rhodococcus]AII11441.1 hypothetical protein EP51_46495 [Rhodococcus opacus]OUS86567.1 hypothetical protein CA951_39025 [Rhodococcus sp. NCIMB 12038]OZE92850.1 hypothetical protein CH301_27925 [Rhodococcus sp. 15-1189-1-1a]OZF08106.1 hypothetical protein CH299_28445 [Rhodococcus sp. 14-2686-1-2]
MLRLSWAIALSFTIAVLAGILIVTRDLSISNDIFKDGVAQAEIVDDTTDQALDGAQQLPPADQALHAGLPQVVGVLDSLSRADHTLGTLGDHLHSLGDSLKSADAPLGGIIEAGQSATDQANAAAAPAAEIVKTLSVADAKVQDLGPLLDQSLALSQTIDSKLRIALVLPKIGN